MSLLPQWLGLLAMSLTYQAHSHPRIRGGGRERSPTPSTSFNGEDESDDSAMQHWAHQNLGDMQPGQEGLDHSMRDPDGPLQNMMEELDPIDARKVRQVEEGRRMRLHELAEQHIRDARQNLLGMDDQRRKAVQDAKQGVEKSISTGSQTTPAQPGSTSKKRRNKGKARDRGHEKRQDPQPVTNQPYEPLREELQPSIPTQTTLPSSALSTPTSVAGDHRPRHHREGRNWMSSVRDRGHHRLFAPAAPTTQPLLSPLLPRSATPDSQGTAGPYAAGFAPPAESSAARSALARGMYGTRYPETLDGNQGDAPPQRRGPGLEPKHGPRGPEILASPSESLTPPGRPWNLSPGPSPPPAIRNLLRNAGNEERRREIQHVNTMAVEGIEQLWEDHRGHLDREITNKMRKERGLLRRIVMKRWNVNPFEWQDWLAEQEKRLNDDGQVSG